MKKKILLLIAIICLLTPKVSYASSVELLVEDYVELISNEIDEFSQWSNMPLSFKCLVTDKAGADRYLLYSIGNDSGYLLVDQIDSLCVRFANGIDPITLFNISNSPEQDWGIVVDSKAYVYENGAFSVVINDSIFIRIGNDGMPEDAFVINNSRTRDGAVCLPVPVYDQVGLCIPNAIAGLLRYHYNNGYSNLIGNGVSHAQLADDIASRMTLPGVNAYIAPAVRNYVVERGYSVIVTKVNNPTIQTLYDEVNAGRPVLLGFSDDFSGYSAPHMTVGCGAALLDGIYYSISCDGHEDYRVYQIWGAYNDTIFKIQLI